MKNFLDQFSGVGALSNIKSLTTMKSGKAELKAVSVHTSRAGNPTVKFEFASVLDEKQGHIEYLRLSNVKNFRQSFGIIKYLFACTGNEADKQLLAQLPAPLTELLDKNNQAVTFETDEEFKELQAMVPNIDFFYASEDTKIKTKVACVWSDRTAYAETFTKIASNLVGKKYLLKVEEVEGMQKLRMIKEAIL